MKSGGVFSLFLPAILAILSGAAPGQTPSSVTVAGTLQSETGCPSDWAPDCAATHLTYDATDDMWQGTFSLPAGTWEYKAALNDSWTESYPTDATRSFTLAAPSTVKFYYDHKTRWVTDNRNSVIVTVPGSFQSEIGCPGDWDPSCLRTMLQDADGDGTYTLTVSGPPAGHYEAKVAINESWTENYGGGGVPNGPNIPFTVLNGGQPLSFSYNSLTHQLTISGPALPVALSRFGVE